MATIFQDGRHHLYDFSDMGDLGVKSVIYYDAILTIFASFLFNI